MSPTHDPTHDHSHDHAHDHEHSHGHAHPHPHPHPNGPAPVPTILRPRIFEPWLEFTCGMTTAAVPHDPDSPRVELASALPLLLGIDEPLPVAVGEQVHGSRLVWIGYTSDPSGTSEPEPSRDEERRPSAAEVNEGPLRFFGKGRAAGKSIGGSFSIETNDADDEEPEPESEREEPELLDPPDPGEVLEAPGVDGLLTLEPDLLLGVFTADCVPVVIADRHEKAVAVVHAGRKGTRRGIVRAAVDALVDSGSRVENLYAWVGPSISPIHYEVSAEMAAEFRDHFGHYPGAVQGPENRHLALGLINWCELVASGLEREHVELDARCTFNDAKLFHSYRRDGADAGRMLTFAGFIGER